MNRYREVINKSIILESSPAKVWDALTNPAQTQKYFFSCEIISDWQEGSSIIYKTDHTIQLKGTITKIKPGELFEYSYLPNDLENIPSNYAKVSVEVIPEGDHTKLEITQGPYYDQKKYEESEMGWNYVLNGLKKLIG